MVLIVASLFSWAIVSSQSGRIFTLEGPCVFHLRLSPSSRATGDLASCQIVFSLALMVPLFFFFRAKFPPTDDKQRLPLYVEMRQTTPLGDLAQHVLLPAHRAAPCYHGQEGGVEGAEQPAHAGVLRVATTGSENSWTSGIRVNSKGVQRWPRQHRGVCIYG